MTTAVSQYVRGKRTRSNLSRPTLVETFEELVYVNICVKRKKRGKKKVRGKEGSASLSRPQNCESFCRVSFFPPDLSEKRKQVVGEGRFSQAVFVPLRSLWIFPFPPSLFPFNQPNRPPLGVSRERPDKQGSRRHYP